ncbi:MFS transporter [Kribbella sp. NPDC004536]|uniref:MFS transporter n=1 Tax=Kribbella sp. NPDC004536 TaxID=3364106 RepID=UPI0036CDABE4
MTQATGVVAAPAVAQQRSILGVLVISNALGGIGVASGYLMMGLLGERIGGSTSLAGPVATSTALGAAIIAVPLARMARWHGRRAALSLGYLIATFGALLCIAAAQLSSLPLLLLGGCMFGSGSAANLQSRYSAVDAAEPSRTARSLSVVVWATTIGVVAGPNLIGLGSTIGDRLGIAPLAGPFVISALAFAVGSVVARLGLRHLRPATAIEIARQPVPTTFRQIMARPQARLGLLSIASAHPIMVGIMAMTSVHLRHHGATLPVIGVVLSGHGAGMYALSPVSGWFADRLGRTTTIGIGLAILAVALTIAVVAPGNAHTAVGVSLFLLGLGWSACLVAGSTLLSSSVPGDLRTSAQGVSDLTMGLLSSVAGIVSGPVLAHLGFHWLAMLCGLLLIPVALLAATTGDKG